MERFRRPGAMGLRHESARTRVLRAASIGLLVGIFGIGLSVLPSLRGLEESVGLRLLFWVRSSASAPPPPPVVVVSIDDATPIRGYLPTRVTEWPRSIHGELVDRLTQLGASAIAFDIEFFRNGDASEDARFADAIRRSGRVVLVQRLRVTDSGGHSLWERQDPIPPLAGAAAAVAPAPLPDAALVSSYWTFLRTPAMGDVATLPTSTLQVHARIRNVPVGELPRVAHFNFYGPPGTICTIPYDAVIANSPASHACSVEGRAVFVGAGFSRTRRSDQLDSYHTVYPLNARDRTDGIDFSGVELHATAFANLLTGNVLRPAGVIAQLLTLFTFGFCVGAGAYFTRTRRRYAQPAVWGKTQTVAVAALLAVLYTVVAYLSFAAGNFVVPVVIPFVQAVVAIVPAIVVPPVVHGGVLRCVCLATDVEKSAERNSRSGAAVTGPAYRRYEKRLDRILRRAGAHPARLIGDAKTSIWLPPATSAGPNADLKVRRRACLAALAANNMIRRSHERYNDDEMDAAGFPTRLGMHVGDVDVSSDADRGLLNVVGTAADVAARLQEWNKFLRGSGVLATADVVENLDDMLVLRRLGNDFHVKGPNKPYRLFEIVALATRATDRDRELCRRFEDALAHYEAGRFGEAKLEFERINRDFADDGPTQWYLSKLRSVPPVSDTSESVAV